MVVCMAREPRFRTKVWDLPIRLFHWSLVGFLVLSYVSGKWHLGWWHDWSGRALLVLLVFRLLWGFVGSETSRFRTYFASPRQIWRYWATFGQREPDNQIGHNPAGGVMVFVLLGLVTAQVVMGLLATSRSGAHGPLAFLIAPALSHRITGWHVWNVNLLIGATVLHGLAIAFYAVFKRHDLVTPMITGNKRLPGRLRTPKMESPVKALVLLVISCMILWVILKMGYGR
jgi:cytochrome b